MKTKFETGKKLLQLGLKPDNSVVIGSGILQALGIRDSKDIDLVVTKEAFDHLKKLGVFKTKMSVYKQEVIYNDTLEIGQEWLAMERPLKLNDLIKDSVIIEGVRYLSLNLLYKIKKSWIDAGTARQKDVEDVKLIEKYLNKL